MVAAEKIQRQISRGLGSHAKQARERCYLNALTDSSLSPWNLVYYFLEALFFQGPCQQVDKHTNQPGQHNDQYSYQSVLTLSRILVRKHTTYDHTKNLCTPGPLGKKQYTESFLL